ncbi:hypothetical protein PV646_15540 [Streptomyces sp. ID05-26A]|nr:hypothetical protein [Streptomyces sp. ID05-26A]
MTAIISAEELFDLDVKLSFSEMDVQEGVKAGVTDGCTMTKTCTGGWNTCWISCGSITGRPCPC